MKKVVLFYSLLLLSMALAHAQTSVNMGSQSSVVGCDITIYDNGGSNGSYGASRNDVLTVYPTANSGRIAIEVISLDIYSSDTLYIYDGTTADGTPLAMLNNSTFNTEFNTHFFMASTDNPTGALTLRFTSTYFWLTHGSGFQLHSTCAAACLPFQIAFDTAHCSHLPILNPTDSYYYIDLCENEPLHLAVNGIYSNSEGGDYPRSDASTTFIWSLDESTTVTGIGRDSITHIFPPGSGCEVSILANDTLQCPVQQPIAFRVRTSQNPIARINALPPICLGETLTPTIGYEEGSTVQLHRVGFTQHASLKVSDTVFLPDGVNCPPYGIYYRSNVTFTEFASTATITSANDILYVRIKMEHSAIEDLRIDIFCPNGNTSNILPQPNYQGSSMNGYFRVNLGSAYRPDGGTTCDASLNPMGEPWNYVWSNNNTLGYQYASSNGSCFSPSNFNSHYNPHWDESNSLYFNDSYHSFSVDSTNVAAMTQVYRPYQNFSSLVGCPLNGNWYIQVQDLEIEDNGYIVEWELALNPDLLPSIWEFNLSPDTSYITGTQVLEGMILQPEETGSQPFTATILDDFGCRYDTTFQVTVYEPIDVELGDDLHLCNGQSVTLGPENTYQNYQYRWSTGASTPQITVNEAGTYILTASLLSNGTVICQSSDTVEVFENEVMTASLPDTLCAGLDYHRNGFTISAGELGEGSFYTANRTETAANGCDSVITLQLTILPRYEHEFSTRACELYRWAGDDYTVSGDYTKNFVTVGGCDSIVTLHLAIGHPEERSVTEVSCGPYTWGGNTLTTSGEYQHTFPSSYGCDSVVNLQLTVVDTFLRTFVSNPDFCDTRETFLSVEGSFDQYVWSTGEEAASIFVTESGTYSVTASNYACERVARIVVPGCPLYLYLPNAITPSRADGLNDVFFLPDYSQRMMGDDFQITIFNRWGEIVFYSEDKSFRWDGTVNGMQTIDIVYSYILRCTDLNGKPHLFKGTITVL